MTSPINHLEEVLRSRGARRAPMQQNPGECATGRYVTFQDPKGVYFIFGQEYSPSIESVQLIYLKYDIRPTHQEIMDLIAGTPYRINEVYEIPCDDGVKDTSWSVILMPVYEKRRVQ